jgi:hypothetical protein
MTVETKTTVQLSDIASIEFECNNCHRIISTPLLAAKNPQTECECSSQQWMTVGGDTYRQLTQLIILVQQFSGSRNEPFTMRFGLKSSASDRASGGRD